MEGPDSHVMVYRNRHLGCWSVLRGGRVVARAQSLALEDVVFRVRAGGRDRACRVRQRNVHAFACGRLAGCGEVPPGALPFRYDPYGSATFTLADGTPVMGARRAYFVPSGAFLEEPQLLCVKVSVSTSNPTGGPVQVEEFSPANTAARLRMPLRSPDS